jgi:hypothetical protein
MVFNCLDVNTKFNTFLNIILRMFYAVSLMNQQEKNKMRKETWKEKGGRKGKAREGKGEPGGQEGGATSINTYGKCCSMYISA